MIDKNRAKRYCSEDISHIEGYDKAVADKDGIWDLHHRAEILPCGNYSREILKKYNLYDHRPAAELIFLPHDEHARLHHIGEKNPFFGKCLSEAHKKKISQSLSGEKNNFFGHHHSIESRKKISQSLLGTHYWNNGVKTVRATTCPPGFVKGRLYRRRTALERGEDQA